jgi:hypothetical protein
LIGNWSRGNLSDSGSCKVSLTTQTEIVEAKSMRARATLKVLFELLENYAPMWYTEDHHNLVADALGKSAENATQASAAQADVLQIQSHRYKARGARTGEPSARAASIQ